MSEFDDSADELSVAVKTAPVALCGIFTSYTHSNSLASAPAVRPSFDWTEESESTIRRSLRDEPQFRWSCGSI